MRLAATPFRECVSMNFRKVGESHGYGGRSTIIRKNVYCEVKKESKELRRSV